MRGSEGGETVLAVHFNSEAKRQIPSQRRGATLRVPSVQEAVQISRCSRIVPVETSQM